MSEKNTVVDASPVKSFFVQMLIRDIELSDAILDLLDNCIDGVVRTSKHGVANRYKGYRIEIELSKRSFMIRDNCGGIPLDILKNYAFRMGRVASMPKDNVATVGTFGIGMKRAIFKMGERCEVLTRSSRDFDKGSKKVCKVTILPEWIKDEQKWDIPYEMVASSELKDFGTQIYVSDLNESTKKVFDCESSGFDEKMRQQISVTYGFMISKGLEITVNGKEVVAAPLVLKCGDGVSPYVYKATIEGVDVFLAIGLTAPLLEGDGTLEDSGPAKYSAQYAGWTVMCNDRVVLYADKSILTGWGEAGVPQFHPQYNSICGIVAFNATDARALPTTTTKRGIDAANPIYLKVKNFMREGTKACVKFTNDWKTREAEVRGVINAVRRVHFQDMKEDSKGALAAIKFVAAGKGFPGKVAKAKLPVPPRKDSGKVTCSFLAEKSHVASVAEFLQISAVAPGKVAQEAFCYVYEEAIES